MKKFFICISFLTLLTSCAQTQTPPTCKNEKCVVKNCSYEAGYNWGTKGYKPYSICPDHLEGQYLEGYQAGRRSYLTQLKRQMNREIRPY